MGTPPLTEHPAPKSNLARPRPPLAFRTASATSSTERSIFTGGYQLFGLRVGILVSQSRLQDARVTAVLYLLTRQFASGLARGGYPSLVRKSLEAHVSTGKLPEFWKVLTRSKLPVSRVAVASPSCVAAGQTLERLVRNPESSQLALREEPLSDPHASGPQLDGYRFEPNTTCSANMGWGARMSPTLRYGGRANEN